MKFLFPSWDPAMGWDEVKAKWACFVVGTTLLALGALGSANLFVDAAPPVRFIGAMMVLGAVAQLLHAMLVTGWGGLCAWLFSGTLYGAAGIIAVRDPALVSVTAALGLVLALALSGILRARTSFRLRPQAGWRWLGLSGGLTMVAGLVVAVGWPVDNAWLLASVLAADLASQGLAAVAFGVALKAHN